MREGRAHLARVPRLVPVFSHRYLSSDPQFKPSPVFSVHQSDVIFYGDNLLDYVAHEFRIPPLHPSDRTHVPFCRTSPKVLRPAICKSAHRL